MDRRTWLRLTGAGALLTGGLPAKEAAQVKITGLEVFRVHVNRLGNWILFRLQTSEGLTGIGDASHGGKDDFLVINLAKRFLERMRGKSIFDIESLRRAIHPEAARIGRPAAVAFGGLEQCLWDLQGKALGLPTYQLFGGMLNRQLRCYANINRSTVRRDPEGFAESARSAVKAGFDAIKLAPFDGMAGTDAPAAQFERDTQLGIDCIAAVREVVGPDRDVLVDAHRYFDAERGMRLPERLEPYNLFWLEEVVTPFEELAAINKAANMPTAGGESIFGVENYFRYISSGAVDIVMPDIKYCGGMMELKKISAMAEGAGMKSSPHGPASPVGGIAAAHVCATLPNFQVLEHSHGEVDWRAELVDPPERIENGLLTIPERPGFGYTLNEDTIHRHTP